MDMKRYSLGIVQPHTTQFDGPLFRRIAMSPDIDLTVYYTCLEAINSCYDPELGRPSGWDHDITSGYRSKVYSSGKLSQLRFVKELITSGHDLIVVSGYSSPLILLIAIIGKLYSVPVGLRSDSVFLYREQETWKWKLKDRLLPLLYKLYTTGHPTGSLASTYMQHYGFSSDELFLLSYAVDNDYLRNLFIEVVPQREALRDSIGIAPSDIVILGILKFVPREDPLTLLRAYKQIVATHPYVHLIMVGDGEQRSIIEDYIATHSLENVHLPGYVQYSQLPTHFAMADVFVHPATREPWGVSVNEAMVCGLPVVTSDKVGAAADLIEEGKTGLVFQATNPKSLAVALEQLITNPDLRRTMSKNAITRVSSWTYEITYRNLIDALNYVRSQRSQRQKDLPNKEVN
jgi:glycosyltransferase involved in cell wall biosynthesis